MYELCKTESYNDCLVGDIDTFAQDIHSNPQKSELLARIKTLRVYQADQLLLKEPTYAQLLSDHNEWRMVGPRLTTTDELAALKLAVEDPEFADRFLSGPAYESLRSAATKGAFDNLERVTMTREVETFQWGVLQEEYDMFNEALDPPPLPFFFANLPSVAHYCEWSTTGPLAFPNQTIKVDRPPKIITIHAPTMLEELGPFWFPPIMLGATNRLMFNSSNLICSNITGAASITYESMVSFMSPLEEMFGGIPVIQATADGYEAVPFDTVSLDNTRVEIYDYVRHCTFSDMSDMKTADSRPTDLSEIQSIFDERIGSWKGKVFLKNREDCPPCSACGFEGFWKYK
jgi:hypothetical protein